MCDQGLSQCHVRQVRNLASCVKVAVDFVLPESLDQAFKFAQDFGDMGKEEAWEVDPSSGEQVYVDPVNRQHADKLQAELSMCLAAKHAVEVLNGKATGVRCFVFMSCRVVLTKSLCCLFILQLLCTVR